MICVESSLKNIDLHTKNVVKLEKGSFLFVILLILFALLAQGCLPIPNTERLTPAVYGILTDNVHTLESIEVVISDKISSSEPCKIARQKTKTNERGEFNMTAVTQRYSTMLLLGHSVYEWQICAFIDGRSVELLQVLGYQKPPRAINIQCDISVEPKCIPLAASD